MSDLIKREDAILWVKTECNPYGKPTLDFESGKKVIEHLEHMPSADRPQGEWVEAEEDWRHQIEFWKCSECGFAVSSRYNYCPNCGARMLAKDTNVPNKKGADDE